MVGAVAVSPGRVTEEQFFASEVIGGQIRFDTPQGYGVFVLQAAEETGYIVVQHQVASNSEDLVVIRRNGETLANRKAFTAEMQMVFPDPWVSVFPPV